MQEAPLFALTMAITQQIFTTAMPAGALGDRIQTHALSLLEEISLAFRGVDREAHLDRADELLTTLRIMLRLADRCGALGQGLVVDVLVKLDEAGRQVGGWQKRLYSDTVDPRHRGA